MCVHTDDLAGPRISRVILIDREADLVTPCMSQITLEGLIDEVSGIRGGSVQLGGNKGKPVCVCVCLCVCVYTADAPCTQKQSAA